MLIEPAPGLYPLVHVSHPAGRPDEGRGNRRGDEQHAQDGAHPEDDDVQEAERHRAKGAQDQQGEGCAPGQAVYQAYHQRPEAHLPVGSGREEPRGVACYLSRQRPQESLWLGVVVGMAGRRLVRVKMGVCGLVMLVDVAVQPLLQESAHVEDAQRHQHEPDAALHAEGQSLRDAQAKGQHYEPHYEQRRGVADAPEDADRRRAQQASRLADDGGHRHDMVRVRGVLNAEEKAKSYGGQYRRIHPSACSLLYAGLAGSPWGAP